MSHSSHDGSAMDHPATEAPQGAGSAHGGHGSTPGGNAACQDLDSLVMFSYENWWVLPVLLVHAALFPLACYYRAKAIRQNDPHLKLRAYALMAGCWALVLLVTVGTSGVNHAPARMNPFDTRLVFSLWLVLFPSYILARDVASSPLSKLCCCCCSDQMQAFLGKFWDYALCGIGSYALPIVGMWTAIGYHELNTDIGHIVPALGFIAYSGLLLYNAGSERRLTMEFMRAEGYMWISWGLFFDVYFTLLQVGLNGWTIGEQHLYQALMYVWTGGTAVSLAKQNIRTGMPMFTLCFTMGIMMMHHVQYCPVLSMMHQTTGLMFIVSGLFRYFDRILETSFFMMMAGATFAFSNNASVFWADAHFDSMSYIFFVMVVGGTWWSYMGWMFAEDWNDADEAATKKMYLPVHHVNGDAEDGMEMAVKG